MTDRTGMVGTVFESTLGYIGLAANENGLARIVLPTTRAKAEREVRSVCPGGLCRGKLPPILATAREQIKEYLDGKRSEFDLPVATPEAGDFFQRVWRVCGRIPYGETRSYGWIAKRVGKPGAARGVGQAMGANPLPLVVPCHRVVRSDGGLGGFGGGLPLKKRLLELEGARVG